MIKLAAPPTQWKAEHSGIISSERWMKITAIPNIVNPATYVSGHG